MKDSRVVFGVKVLIFVIGNNLFSKRTKPFNIQIDRANEFEKKENQMIKPPSAADAASDLPKGIKCEGIKQAMSVVLTGFASATSCAYPFPEFGVLGYGRARSHEPAVTHVPLVEILSISALHEQVRVLRYLLESHSQRTTD